MGKKIYQESDLHRFINCDTMILKSEGVVYETPPTAAQVRGLRLLCSGAARRGQSARRGRDRIGGQGPFQVHWLLGESSPRGHRTEVFTFQLSTRLSPFPQRPPTVTCLRPALRRAVHSCKASRRACHFTPLRPLCRASLRQVGSRQDDHLFA